jgi:hypothetical protein
MRPTLLQSVEMDSLLGSVMLLVCTDNISKWKHSRMAVGQHTQVASSLYGLFLFA